MRKWSGVEGWALQETEFALRCTLGTNTWDRSGADAGLAGRRSWEVMQAAQNPSHHSRGSGVEVSLQGCWPFAPPDASCPGKGETWDQVFICMWPWPDNELQGYSQCVLQGRQTLQELTAGGWLVTTLPAAGQPVLPWEGTWVVQPCICHRHRVVRCGVCMCVVWVCMWVWVCVVCVQCGCVCV